MRRVPCLLYLDFSRLKLTIQILNEDRRCSARIDFECEPITGVRKIRWNRQITAPTAPEPLVKWWSVFVANVQGLAHTIRFEVSLVCHTATEIGDVQCWVQKQGEFVGQIGQFKAGFALREVRKILIDRKILIRLFGIFDREFVQQTIREVCFSVASNRWPTRHRDRGRISNGFAY